MRAPPDGVTLRVNGTTVAPDSDQPEPNRYHWRTGADIWKEGLNQVFVVGRPGLRVTDIEFVRRP
jgi:hypothetical protein